MFFVPFLTLSDGATKIIGFLEMLNHLFGEIMCLHQEEKKSTTEALGYNCLLPASNVGKRASVDYLRFS